MANKKINELDSRATLTLSDLMAVGDPSTGYLYKTTISDLKTLTGAGVVSFNGRFGSVVPAEGDYSLTQLSDVIITSASNNQVLRYNGSNWVNATIDLSGYVPYTGATANVNLGTFDLTADVITGATGSFASSGGSNTFAINHSSGSGIALSITKGGNGEGIYINKTSGSGNAATIVGKLEATTLVKTGGTSSQFLKADGSVDSSTYLTTSNAASTYVPYTGANANVTLGAFDLTAKNLFFNTNTQTFKISNPVAVGSFGSNIFIGDGGNNITYTSGDTGSYNTSLGFAALSNITTGYRNTIIGQSGMSALTTGYFNIAIGDNAGRFFAGTSNLITTANSSIFIGRTSQASANGNTNEIVIGTDAIGNGSNSTTLGNSSITKTIIYGNLLLGTTTDNAVNKLQVTGTAIISSSITASSFIKSGGLSSELLVANGQIVSYSTPNTISSVVLRGLSGEFSAGNITSTSFIKSGGTASEFLKANGSVDSNTYLTTSAASSTYLPLSGGTLTGALNGTSAVFSGSVTASQLIATDVESGISANYYGTYSGGSTPLSFIYGSTGSVTWNNGGVKMTLTSAGALQLASSLSATSGTFSSSVSAATNFRLNGQSFSQVAIMDTGGGIAGGYNFNINSDIAQHNSNGASSGYWYDAAGQVNFFTNGSALAGTALSPRIRITSGGTVLVGTTSNQNFSKLVVAGAICYNNNTDDEVADNGYGMSFAKKINIVAGSGANSIYTAAGSEGALYVVSGLNLSTASRFVDLVLYLGAASTAPIVVSSREIGGPVVRTYTNVGETLTLSLTGNTNTYTIRMTGMGANEKQ